MKWVSGRKASVVGLSAPDTRTRVPVSAAATTARDREARSRAVGRPEDAARAPASRSQGSAASCASPPMRKRGGRSMVAQICGDRRAPHPRRRCRRDFGALRREHGRHQFEQRLAAGAAPAPGSCRADERASRSSTAVLACSVLARDAEAPRGCATAPKRGLDRSRSLRLAPPRLAVKLMEGLALRRRQIARVGPGTGRRAARLKRPRFPASRASSGAIDPAKRVIEARALRRERP